MDHEDFTITTGQPCDKIKILDFLLKYFLVDEPMNQAAKIRKEDFLPIAEAITTRCLRTPFSAVARDSETTEIVGVSLNSVWIRGDEENEYYNTRTRTDEVARAHDKIMNEIHSSFWKLVPNEISTVLHRGSWIICKAHINIAILEQFNAVVMCTSLLSITAFLPPNIRLKINAQYYYGSEISSVSPYHRRRGIASRLYSKCFNKTNIEVSDTCFSSALYKPAENFFQKFGIQGVVSEASSKANQQLLKKQGFQVLREIMYEDYRGSNGEVLLRPNDGSKSIALNWKPLNIIKIQ